MFSGFDPEVSKKLEQFIVNQSKKTGSHKGIAVFDADGTLWRGDIGEAFFRDQVARGTVPHAPPKNEAWNFYFNETIKGDCAKAFGWLAQWNTGVKETDLKAWAKEFYEREWAKLAFEPVRQLVRKMTEVGIEVWVVSGSIRWVVAAGAATYGIPEHRVIGTSVDVENGVLTDRIEHGIIPYRGGKVQLMEKKIKQTPIFAGGNTYWDKEMMTTATELALAIHSEHRGEPNFESEQKLFEHAKSQGWLTQKF